MDSVEIVQSVSGLIGRMKWVIINSEVIPLNLKYGFNLFANLSIIHGAQFNLVRGCRDNLFFK